MEANKFSEDLLPENMSSLNLGELSLKDADWKYLTLERPSNAADEVYITRLLEISRLSSAQTKQLSEEASSNNSVGVTSPEGSSTNQRRQSYQNTELPAEHNEGTSNESMIGETSSSRRSKPTSATTRHRDESPRRCSIMFSDILTNESQLDEKPLTQCVKARTHSLPRSGRRKSSVSPAYSKTTKEASKQNHTQGHQQESERHRKISAPAMLAADTSARKSSAVVTTLIPSVKVTQYNNGVKLGHPAAKDVHTPMQRRNSKPNASKTTSETKAPHFELTDSDKNHRPSIKKRSGSIIHTFSKTNSSDKKSVKADQAKYDDDSLLTAETTSRQLLSPDFYSNS